MPEAIEVDQLPDQYSLVGFVVGQGWVIQRLMHDLPPESGSNYGVGYVVRHAASGRIGFLKAIDYLQHAREPAKVLEALRAARFESEMLEYCAARRMSKIIMMLDSGTFEFRRRADGHIYPFAYIVMELGEGDIKGHVEYAPNGNCHWKLCVLRDVALGISQLEKADLAHNDVKPSNVIVVAPIGELPNLKLGDLGRVVKRDGTGPYDQELWPGDPCHRPPEIMYGTREPEWQNWRTAADAFMLGNLMSYLFAGVSISERIENSLPPNYRPQIYHGCSWNRMSQVSWRISNHCRPTACRNAPCVVTRIWSRGQPSIAP